MPESNRVCSVFISSTSEDLKEYRAKVAAAIRGVGLHAVDMDDFPATECPPLQECLKRVAKCQVVVAVIAHRYGWVPAGQPDAKSITWLECEHALSKGIPVLAFYVEPTQEWSEDKKEDFRLVIALRSDDPFPVDLPNEIRRNKKKLQELKTLLAGEERTRKTFTTPDDLRSKVAESLHHWLDERPECKPNIAGDPTLYLVAVKDETTYIDIQALNVGAGKASRFEIGELYIPLTTPAATVIIPAIRPDEPVHERERNSMDLKDLLIERRLVIVGDPGSGKSTFLRWIAQEKSVAALAGTGTEIPLLIRIGELAGYVKECRLAAGSGKHWDTDSHEWLPDFLAARCFKFKWGLGAAYFRQILDEGEAVVLLDGLDEAPDAGTRAEISRLFQHATAKYESCRFVVTTRPDSFVGANLLQGFREAWIEPLDADARAAFFEKWARCLHPNSATEAEQRRDALVQAVEGRDDIQKLATTPVMLTAIAVVHWNEKRLPEERVDLYETILMWLARQRESKGGRERPERCLKILEQLALAMHDEEGRLTDVSLEWAATRLANQFSGVEKAREFLDGETTDSGIVMARGKLRFFHLTFQEYLAARAIAGMDQEDQVRRFRGERIFQPEWKEVMLLLSGILAKQGLPKVDVLVNALLPAAASSLHDKARAAALLGALVRDLRVFGYQPPDEAYRELMLALPPIFELEWAAQIPFQIRLEAADALGLHGDPRFAEDMPNRVRIQGAGGVKAFEIGRYPVTVVEYQRFVEAGGYRDERFWTAGGFGLETEPRDWNMQQSFATRPVTGVNWYEAKAYCAWAGRHLPSEAEWKLAAYGPEGRQYPWGDQEPDATRANYLETGPRHVSPVGLYRAGATPENVEEMAGNVWEWVEDRDDTSSTFRVLQGAAWFDVASHLGSGIRDCDQPDFRYDDIGLRVARELNIP